MCANRAVRRSLLDRAVWNDVRGLLEDPGRVERELQRRLSSESPEAAARGKLQKQIQQVERSIARLIDVYGNGTIEACEFEPRVRGMRQQLSRLQGELQSQTDREARHREMRLLVDNLAAFGEQVRSSLAQADWATQRELIRLLVKRVEVDKDRVNIVYRVDIRPFDRQGGACHYCRGRYGAPMGLGRTGREDEACLKYDCVDMKVGGAHPAMKVVKYAELLSHGILSAECFVRPQRPGLR